MLKRARKTARIMLVYALLGLGASIAVAWGLVFCIDMAKGTAWSSSGSDKRELPFTTPSHDYLREQIRFASRSFRTSLGSSRRALLYDPRATLRDELNHYPILVLNHLLDDDNTYHPANHFIPEPVNEYIQSMSTPPKWKLDFNAAIPDPTAWGKLYHFEPKDLQDTPLFWLEDARGFPFLCLWSSWTKDSTGLVGSGGFQLPDLPVATTRNSMGLRVRALPYRLIWAGLAANTVFYGLLTWLLVRLLKGMRAGSRFKKGLCTKCAYDLLFDYSHGCPECGWRRATATQQK